MTTTLKISRGAFKKLSQDALATYAESILKNCQGKPAYAVLDALLLELQPVITEYNAALVEARERAISAVAHKNNLKAKVLELLDRIARVLELNATDNEFVLKAGMQLTEKQPLSKGAIPAPFSVSAMSTGNRGEALIQMSLESPRMVRMNAVEYSSDGGQTWTNGTYDKRSRFVVSNLPNLQTVMIRVRSIGTRGRLSEWSEPVLQSVL